MFYSFSEKKPTAIALLVSDLKTSLYQRIRARTLLASLPSPCYLVSVQPALPPAYYQIPCIADTWQQEREQARQELLSLGAELAVSPEHCLLVTQEGFFFKKARLQRQLTHRLKCPVRLLRLTGEASRPITPTVIKHTQKPIVRSRSAQRPFKIRVWTQTSALS